MGTSKRKVGIADDYLPTENLWRCLCEVVEWPSSRSPHSPTKYIEKTIWPKLVERSRARYFLTALGAEVFLREANRREKLRAAYEGRAPRHFTRPIEVALQHPERMDFDDTEPLIPPFPKPGHQ